jgi:sugar-phosphatase
MPAMIKAIIFDFDGIIVDSEPLWGEAEKQVFEGVGVNLTPEMCRATTGLNTPDTVQHWFNIFPWEGKSLFQVYKEITETMHTLIMERVDLKEGYLDVLQLFVDKHLTVAVASSSPLRLITAALKKFHIFNYFKIINSAENHDFGKPHPALYLGTASKLGLDPVHCLAFEDSFHGSIAAKAARMKLVAVPDETGFSSKRFDFADLKLSSLKEFTHEQFEWLNSLY